MQSNQKLFDHLKSPLLVETCGKWILAGEHAVLRGSEAVVFPLKSARLKLVLTAKKTAPSSRLRVLYTGTK
ncbi:MAG: hypothetical protein ACK5P5_12075, partial [Pseudobdellovibrionaceae bacterium]